MLKKILLGIGIFIIIFIAGAYWANNNNPYTPGSWVTTFFTTRVEKDGSISLTKSRNLHFINTPLGKIIFYIEAFFRIEGNAHYSEKPFVGNDKEIIAQIHHERFDVTKPYVISGGHFAEFYVRNFGIFNSAMLDARFALSQSDWITRQRVTLQTIATHLELLKQAGKEYTTFVPISSNDFVGANFEEPPSDSLFAVIYTLSALTDPTFIQRIFPASSSATYTLQTQQAGKKLLTQYRTTLEKSTSDYLHSIIDPKTGIIRKDIYLSSARDGIKRKSSFYDNVIAWSTTKMALDLGLHITCPKILQNSHGSCDIATWKQKIIQTFWDEKTGIFIDDLTEASKKEHIFSGDEFIVTSSQFLNLQDQGDRQKLLRIIAYVEANKLDKPLPLRYALHNQLDKLHFFVRYFATSYMGESIWSHWGQEYIKSLILLSDDKSTFISDAERDLTAYKQAIEKYGGYPELYNKDGTIFMTPFYKSVLHTSWVVNYEQAKMMLQSKKNILDSTK